MNFQRSTVALAVFVVGVVAACATPRPTPRPASTPIAVASTQPSPTEPPATPDGTISIGCFLAVQAIVDEFRHLDAQVTAFLASEQGDVLGPFVERTQDIVVGAPTGCFTDGELTAFEAFWHYAATTRPRDLETSRIRELLAAVGIPYPTAAP